MNPSIQASAAPISHVVQWLGVMAFTAINFLAVPADKIYPSHTMVSRQAGQHAGMWAPLDSRCCGSEDQQLVD
jgi:hypothetical protein